MKLISLLFSSVLLLSYQFAGGQSLAVQSHLYEQGRLDEVITLGEKELQRDDKQPAMNLLVGRAYADKKMYAAAIPYLQKSAALAADQAWIKAWSWAYLGPCYYMTQDYAQAKGALDASIGLQATANATAYASKRRRLLQLDDTCASWQVVETEHIRFHFQAPAALAPATYAATREQAYQRINQFFGAELVPKINFYVWADPTAARQRLGRELGFANPEWLIINAHQDQTKGHELTHILLQYGLAPTHETQFISEGAAVCFDQTTRNRLQTAQVLLPGPVSVWRMWEHPEEFPEAQVYAVGGALLDYLLANAPAAQVKRLLRDQRPAVGKELFGNLITEFESTLAKK